MLLKKPALEVTPTARKAAAKGKGLHVVRHGRYDSSITAAYGLGVKMPARQDQFITKAAADKNYNEHMAPLVARYYATQPQRFYYSADEVAAAVFANQ